MVEQKKTSLAKKLRDQLQHDECKLSRNMQKYFALN